jgi:hypothetical protein
MTPKARTAALAKIHIGKKQVGMADEAYRAMLVNIGGVRPVPGQEPSTLLLKCAG